MHVFIVISELQLFIDLWMFLGFILTFALSGYPRFLHGYFFWEKITLTILFTCSVIVFQGDTIYLFYETKNSNTLQGDIGVAKSTDKGATWQQEGIALDEDWHLSYPYVFNYLGQVRLEYILCTHRR